MYNNYNPYFNQMYKPLDNNFSQNNVSTPIIQQSGLQGKLVESIDVVRVTDIPMNGSVSYFPLADGSAIITKQFQSDGTVKMGVFKPSEEEKDSIVTTKDLKEVLDEVKNEISELKNTLNKEKGE